MTEGPSRSEIDRVREALEHHDTDLRAEDEPEGEEPDEAARDDENDE
jgi:hypothetical protein